MNATSDLLAQCRAEAEVAACPNNHEHDPCVDCDGTGWDGGVLPASILDDEAGPCLTCAGTGCIA